MLAHDLLSDLIDVIGPEDSLALLLWLLVASEGKAAWRCK
jgi:hypothetical protein